MEALDSLGEEKSTKLGESQNRQNVLLEKIALLEASELEGNENREKVEQLESELTSRNAEIEAILERSKSTSDQAGELGEQLTQIRAELVASETENETLLESKERMILEREEAATLHQNQVQELQEAFTKRLQSELQGAAASNQEQVHGIQEKNALLTVEMEALQTHQVELQNELTSAGAAQSAWAEEKDSLLNQIRERDSLSTETENARGELENLFSEKTTEFEASLRASQTELAAIRNALQTKTLESESFELNLLETEESQRQSDAEWSRTQAQLQEKISLLETTGGEAASTLEVQASALLESEKSGESSRAALTQLQQELEQVQSMLLSTQEALEETSALQITERSRIEELQEKWVHWEKEASENAKFQTELANELSGSQAEIVRLESVLKEGAEASAAKEATLQESLGNLNAKAATAEEELEKTRAHLQESQEQWEAQAAQSNATHTEELEALQAAMEEANTTHKTSLHALQRSVDERTEELGASQLAGETLRGEIEERKTALGAQETALENLKQLLTTQQDELKQLGESKTELEEEHAAQAKSLANQTYEVEHLTNRMKEFAKIKQVASERAQNLSTLAEEKSQIFRELAEKETEISLLQDENSMLRRDASLPEEMEKLRKSGAEAETRASRLASELEMLKNESAASLELQTELETSRAELATKEEALQALHTQGKEVTDALELELSSLRKSLSESQNQQEGAGEQGAALQEEIESLRGALSRTQGELLEAQEGDAGAALQDEVVGLKNELLKAEQAKNKAESLLEEAQNAPENEASSAKVGQLEAEKQEALGALSTERDKLASLEEAFKKLQESAQAAPSEAEDAEKWKKALDQAALDEQELRKDNQELQLENVQLQTQVNDARTSSGSAELQAKLMAQANQFSTEMRVLVTERDALSKKVALLVDAALGQKAEAGVTAPYPQKSAARKDVGRDELKRTLNHIQRCVMELEHGKEKVKLSKNRLKQMERLLPQLGKIWQQINDGIRELQRTRESDPVANHLGNVLGDLKEALRSTRSLLDTVQSTSDSQEELIASLYKTLTKRPDTPS